MYYRGCIGIRIKWKLQGYWGSYWGYIGIVENQVENEMENEMETTIMGVWWCGVSRTGH